MPTSKAPALALSGTPEIKTPDTWPREPWTPVDTLFQEDGILPVEVEADDDVDDMLYGTAGLFAEHATEIPQHGTQ